MSPNTMENFSSPVHFFFLVFLFIKGNSDQILIYPIKCLHGLLVSWLSHFIVGWGLKGSPWRILQITCTFQKKMQVEPKWGQFSATLEVTQKYTLHQVTQSTTLSWWAQRSTGLKGNGCILSPVNMPWTAQKYEQVGLLYMWAWKHQRMYSYP